MTKAVQALAHEKKRVRQTVEFSDKLHHSVTELATEHSLSISEVIRDALKLLIEFNQLKKEGYHLGGWKTYPDGTRENVRIVIGI